MTKRQSQNFIQRYLEKKDSGEKLRSRFYAALALSVIAVLLDQYGFHPHPHFEFEKIPAFHAIFGLASCLLLFFGSKFYGKFISVSEDYYNREYRDYFVKDEHADETRVEKIMELAVDNRDGGGE